MNFEPLISQLNLDDYTLKLLYNSIFFPRKLIQRLEDFEYGDTPNRGFQSKYTHLEEHLYILLILESLADVGNRLENYQRKLLQSFEIFRIWFSTQDSNFVNACTLHFYLKQIKPNYPLLLYLRGQNASISIRAQEDPKQPTQITIFQPSSENITFMGSPSDLCNIYPKACFLLSDNSLTNSFEFSEFLADLANFSNTFSKSTTEKKHSETEESRDSLSPALVYEWFLPCCCTEVSEDFVQVIKKYRDNVVCDLKGAPFRRSGMWFTAKIFLNILLVEQFGEKKGKALYKALIINSHFLLGKRISTDIEVDFEIIQKLAKRLKKFKQFELDIPKLYSMLEKDIETFINARRAIMNQFFNGIVSNSRSAKVLLNPYQINFRDIFHDFGNLIKEIRSCLNLSSNSGNVFKSNRNFVRLGLDSLVPSPSIFNSITTDSLCLQDFELWVRLSLNTSEKFKNDYCKIFNILKPYINTAKQIYANNPLGYSRMILTSSKIILIIDSIATKKYPLLLEHKLGINPSFFSNLLLPTISDVKYAQEIFNYFYEREQAKYPNLLDSSTTKRNLFSYRYCQNLDEFETLKKNIYETQENYKKSKVGEVNTEVQKYKDLKNTINSMSCKYSKNWSRNTYHSNECSKCQYVYQARNMSVEVYEKLLPEDEIDVTLVLFELMIPEIIANLRDSIYFYRSLILEEENKNFTTKGTWASESRLQDFSKKIKMEVTLRSYANSFKNTHFCRLSISNNQHPNDFIKPNGYNIQYASESSLVCSNKFDEKKIKEKLSFKNEGNYKNLQWVLNDKYNENQAISRQGLCPAQMSKKEYLKYSLFRAGLSLQLYNLYDAVETRVLSFKKKSVLYLICQSLWEVGPLSICNIQSFTFTIFQELLSSGVFLDQLYFSLSNLLDTCIENWNEQLVLLNIVIIVLRVISFTTSQTQRQKYLALLLRARKIGIEWQQKIEDLLIKLGGMHENLKIKIKNKLAEICCFCILTYNVEREYLKYVIISSQDIVCFLLSITKLFDYVILYGFSDKPFKKNLLAWTKEVILGLETYLIDTLQQNISSLHDFLSIKWPDSQKCINSYSFKYDPKTYSIVYITQTIKGISKTIEIGLDGVFLIDGQSISKLPREISSHELFVRLFNNTDFDIFPSAEDFRSRTTNWIKIDKDIKYRYIFTSFPNKPIQIKEVRDENGQVTELELVPHNFLFDILPYALYDNYSHWLDRTNNKIYFRVKNFINNSFSYQKFFTLDLNLKTIEDITTNRLLMNINSRSFNEFYSKVGYRIELKEYIHMFMDQGTHKITIDLPRLNLGFELSLDQSEIYSKEFKGFKISEDQQIHTLIGLEQGLVLIESRYDLHIAKKNFIVPHGKVQLSYNDYHQQVSLDISEMNNPPFFIFEIDSRFGILRAGESHTAWLYLAYLHAVTSSIVPDPFLKMSGTSRALQILQSPHVFSSTSLPSESNEILTEISELSPKRNFVPPHKKTVEKVDWPEHISSYASHDAFIYLANKITNYSLSFEDVDNNELDIDKMLYEKSYRRILSQNYQLSDEFNDLLNKNNIIDESLQCFGEKIDWNNNFVKSVRKINFTKSNVFDFESIYKKLRNLPKLCWKSKLDAVIGNSGIKLPNYSVFFWISISEKLIEYWIDIYEYCRCCPENEYLGIRYGLTLTCLNTDNIELIYFFNAVLENQSRFNNIEIPEHLEYETLHEDEFNDYQIKKLVESHKISKKEFSSKFYDKSPTISQEEIKAKYKNDKKKSFEKIVNEIKNSWPEKQVKVTDDSLFNTEKINKIVTLLFFKWIKNSEFNDYLKKLKEACNNLPKESDVLFKQVLVENHHPGFKFKPFELVLVSNIESSINIDALKSAKKIYEVGHLIDENLLETDNEKKVKKIGEIPDFPLFSNPVSNLEHTLINDLRKSWRVHFELKNSKKPVKIIENLEKHLRKLLSFYKNQSKKFYEILNSYVFSSDKFNKIFKNSLCFPELTPTQIQKQILSNYSPFFKLNDEMLYFCGAICVIWTLEQRIERCLVYLHSGESQSLALSRELENIPYENWSPKEYPGWLVLQTELNIMIRAVQVEVAKTMLFPQRNTNQVTQLNMGEGKTSLILPMIVMANQNSMIRMTVLKSIFKINKNYLIQKLGGVLNKRVYVIPCRRDTNFNQKKIEVIESLLKECHQKKGVFLTLPEYRLSFKLKGLELARSTKKNLKINESELGSKMVNIERWLELNCRDIIDESDEILSPKFQLVYTMGKQSQICCGKLRWQVLQAVLDLAKNHFSELERIFGHLAISLKIPKNPISYPCFRLLNRDAYEELCSRICFDILKGKAKQIRFFEMKDAEIEVVSEYILNKEVNPSTRQKLKTIICKNTENYEIVTILRGVFSFDILFSVLCKRWRVDYGVNNGSNMIKQAVPYRAKDVPAERAQFAHPDIVIMKTQLSYFYSGLTDNQLDQVFEILKKDPFPKSEYESWILSIPKSVSIDSSIKTLQGVNLSELHQKFEILYPLLRMHTSVINYWLNNCVYPKEAKEFSTKLCNSAWDLCSEKCLMTGFSGTNDSRFLLPLNTNYFEIYKLSGTNGSLIENLLLPENNSYYTLHPGITTQEFLQLISKIDPDIRLLLDVGALMLGLRNKELIQEWLKLRPDLLAGVYFDENDEIKVIDRKGTIISFEMSPFKMQLQACLIYLDDSHTRGTDLKIPKGTIGAVTLGRGLTKDRLMQACMRMRMLGKGHRVSFFACHEVDYAIQKFGEKIGSKEIMEWAIKNTNEMISDQFLYWATQGFSFYRRLQLYEDYQTTNDLNQYSQLYDEHENSDIMSLYEPDRIKIPITEALHNRSIIISNLLREKECSITIFEQRAEEIIDKINNNIGNVNVFTQSFEEEREIELEAEKEEETEIEIKKCANPLNPTDSYKLLNYIQKGKVPEDSNDFYNISMGFFSSSVKDISQPDAWSKRIYLTKDFLETVTKDLDGDSFLKPPKWVCYNSSITDGDLVIISAYEANKFINDFKDKSTCLSLLMPRSRVDQILLFSRFRLEIPQELLQQLAVFSGSMFLDKNEIDEYLNFLGYCPSPRSMIEHHLYNFGMIESCGYVLPENRLRVFGHQKCLFVINPGNLIIKIAEIRNYGVVSRFSHFFEILQNGRRPFY